MIRLILTVLALITATTHAQPSHPWASEPYLGLAVRDTEHGVVVGWVYPGPLGGQSFTSSSGIQRADNLVAINGTPIASRDQFTDLIKSLAPDDEITITYRRSPDADMNASVPKGGQGGEETTISVTLGSRDEWSGTVARGLGDRTIPLPRRGEYEQMIKQRAKDLGVMAPDDGLDALLAHIASVQQNNLDPNTLTHVAHAFQKPLALDGIAKAIDEQIAPIRSIGAEHTDTDFDTILEAALSVIDYEADEILGYEWEPGFGLATDAARSLMRTINESWSVDPAQAEEQISVIRTSTGQLPPTLHLSTIAFRTWLLMHQHKPKSKVPSTKAGEKVEGAEQIYAPNLLDELGSSIPDEHRSPVFSIGGIGDNTYDMSRTDHVIDLGGNDTYIWPEGFERSRNHIIIDMSGNDTYRSDSAFAGPGVGVFAGSIIDDHSGNDTYTSTKLASMATGLFGIGIILDRAGNDTYTNTGPESGWSQGVGFYGIGLIIDREGSDVYHAEKLSQGVGGPRGFGTIIDGGGNDLYQANGPNYGSAYGTPGVYLGMSQGFGFGVRGYAAGGVGLIDDMSGNDQYIAGEFSQGGGYYFGLGMIRDHAGNDLYHGNRYGQAFAAHQAVGILIDDAGDDTYWSMTAASQSGVWDESITLLLDKAGNDAYRCEGLGIGAASMQAIGIFIDLGGDDRYSANPGATLGQSGGNSYHYDTAGVMSFSGFFDLGGGNDIYPGDRANNQSKSTGSRNEDAPENSGLYGVFVDE
ncbi:MAG: PDZ domain-containing protein [Phycisphaerales bacterium]|nr:PDZ domain-containing protein [Phycisphaerales bacterium]